MESNNNYWEEKLWLALAGWVVFKVKPKVPCREQSKKEEKQTKNPKPTNKLKNHKWNSPKPTNKKPQKPKQMKKEEQKVVHRLVDA